MATMNSLQPSPPPIIEQLLQMMVHERASDLFLSESRIASARVDGELHAVGSGIIDGDTLREFMNAVLRPTQRELFDRLGDIDVGMTRPGLGRFRVHFHVQRGALGAVVRAVPGGALELEALGLPEVLRDLAMRPRGLVLIAGSTGSGKSTTMAAMVHHINRHAKKHIVTLEDPIEYIHDDLMAVVTQREVGTDTKDFALGLRHIVRESPDVILIGEMRDSESMNVALSAALTGHLVLSSVHTIDASQTLQRLLGYYPESMREQVCMDLSLCLQAVVAQRLVPKADGDGRVAAVEVMLATPAIKKLVREQRVDEIGDHMSSDHNDGMCTFNRALVNLFERKAITFETGAAYASNPDEFRLSAQGIERGVHAFTTETEALPSIGTIDMRTLLAVALRYGASDIHMVVGSPPIFRIHGSLRRLEVDTLASTDVRRLLFSLLSYPQREQFELDRELDFSLTVTGNHRFRVNAHFQRGTIAVSIRLIPNEIPDPVALGIPPGVHDLANKPQGLVLVVGPTGSGKSTTLATMIHQINISRSCHIITIEDPIEFVHSNRLATIEQREVGADTKSFAAALKFILRQDPDVILIGELRDPETISAALTAAETGHLVFATLHTNDAPQTVDRIVDVFPPHQQPQARAQLASALTAVISQRLLPKAAGGGRVAVFEVLIATPAVRAVIREGKTHQLHSVMETSQSHGMNTLDRAMIDLVKRGVVTPEEAARHMKTPAALKGLGEAPPTVQRP
jgi:pilus retraction protein PilT